MTDVFPGIGLGGYRCYADLQFVAPLDRLNLLIGPNNVGKSATLDFFARVLVPAGNAIISGQKLDALKDIDVRRVRGEDPIPLRYHWPLSSAGLQVLPRDLQRALREVDSDRVYIGAVVGGDGQVVVDTDWTDRVAVRLSDGIWHDLSEQLTGTRGGAPGDDLRRVLEHVRKRCLLQPTASVIAVPAHRQMTGEGKNTWDFGGQGFIQQLDRLKNYEPEEHLYRDQHDRLLDSVREVLELRYFDYNVTQASRTLMLQIDDERRPIASVGTGYEHIVLLIAATILFPDALLCVEEPEVHMHPRLQRRLAEYLRTSTSNQMLISSHSATLIDALQAATFRLTTEADATVVSRPIGGQILASLDDLGYKASDLLQTNCAVWVEGPSDRIYLKWWLAVEAPDLTEGVHYTIMFYGGSLLAGVSASDEPDQPSDRVPLARLNQHFVVVCDSDRTAVSAPLKARVQRIKLEIDQAHHALLWVTAGRCIENYLASDVVESALKEVHPTAAVVEPCDTEWDSPLVAKTAEREAVTVDKVKLANHIAEGQPDLTRLDLNDRIREVIRFIRAANA